MLSYIFLVRFFPPEACAEQQAQHNNTTTTATPNSSSRIGIEATAAAAQSAAQLVHGNGTVVPFDCHADAVKHEANKWIQYTQIGFVTGTLFTASGCVGRSQQRPHTPLVHSMHARSAHLPGYKKPNNEIEFFFLPRTQNVHQTLCNSYGVLTDRFGRKLGEK